MFAGSVNPLMLKPAPEALAAEMVKVALPVLVSVIVWPELLPMLTFPKFTLAGLIVNCGCAAVPVPLSAMVRGDPGALLVIEMLPLALPATVGANLAVKDVFWPALTVTGTVRPVMLKPAPEALAAEIVTLADPEFVKVTGTDPLLPTSRLPKLMLDGFAERAPCVPVPVKATVGSDALLVIETLPEAFPVVVGAYTTVKFVPCPAVRVRGVVIPVTLNPVPLTLTCVTVALVFPVLVKVTD